MPLLQIRIPAETVNELFTLLARLFFAVSTVLALTAVGHGQQLTPQTGGPRQLWPQRPGPARTLDSSRPLPPQQSATERPITPAAEYVPNEVLVQFLAGATEGDRISARAAVGAVETRAMRAGDGRLERMATTLEVPAAVAILQGLPQVEFAEPNWIVHHYATSNDPYYTDGQLWGMYGDTSTPANPFGSGAGELWAQGHVGSNDVYVAVIDEGIDFNHPDLAANMWTNPFDPPNGIDDDGNGKADDVHGWDFFANDNSIYDGSAADTNLDSHGTHVAGTIGARGGNGAGVAGVNWNVRIIGAKFIGPDNGSTADAIEALDYVTDLKVRHGLNIIATNNSWGGGGASQALHQAIIRAAKQGILFIAAAGNGGLDQVGDNNDVVPHYPSSYSTLLAAGSETPASYEAVISVASITSTGGKSGFSNYGSTSVDLGAPGSSIYSTWPQGGYQSISGTSMATPHVTGAAALYKSMNPAANAAEIRDAILSRVVATPSLAGVTVTGGRLDVGGFTPGVPAILLSVGDTTVNEGDSGTTTASFAVSLSRPAPTPITVSYRTADATATSSISWENSGAIVVPESGLAAPYPSTIVVPAGLGTVARTRVVLRGLTHSFPSDVDVLLVSPGGQTVVLMSDVGGSFDVSNVTLTFDDDAPPLSSAALSSGVFRPTNPVTGDFFPSPAPSAPHGSSLSSFNGVAAEGTWRLFVIDDAGPDSGSVSTGWSLQLSTSLGGDYVAASGSTVIPSGADAAIIPVTINGDRAREGNETFSLTVSSAPGAVTVDGVGVGTIVDDDLFTDPSLSGVPIRAVHVAELRIAVNEARERHGLPAYVFTDPTLVPGVTPLRAIHIVQLRDALAEVYAHAGRPQPEYTDSALVPGVSVARAAHILELRAAVLAAP